MKFKFMGIKMNTLYVILFLLAILGVVYLYLDINKDTKESFDLNPTSTSTNVVANLIGNDFYNLPTNQQVKAAVNQPYNKRFAKAIKYAVYALYKMSTGLILLAEKIGDSENIIEEQINQKGRNNIDGMSESDFQEMIRQITQDCSNALMGTQTQLEIIINSLSTAERTLCGDELKTSVQMDIYLNAIEDLKVCRATLSEKISEIPTANILADTADFSMLMVNEVLNYLELLRAELVLLADCESIKNAICNDRRGPREGLNDYEDDESHHDEDHHSNSSRPSNYNNAYSNSLTSNTQSTNLPKGIPGYMVPPGQEDMYILKSEVVPPVCPACPDPILKCNDNSKPPPPCPPCARCPEPAFDCKKVPNYGTGNLGANYNNFNTGFGRMMGPDGLAPPSLPHPVSPENSMFGA